MWLMKMKLIKDIMIKQKTCQIFLDYKDPLERIILLPTLKKRLIFYIIHLFR